MPKFLLSLILLFVLLIPVPTMFAASFYNARPEDPKAVYLDDPAFGAKSDGTSDDTAAIQAAINKVQETTKKGIVFIPEGKYRITKTINVWNGIRLIGFGKNRPVIILAEKTPGFQELGSEKTQGAPSPGKYMFHFVSDRPRNEGDPIRDANPGTFYSAFSNIDVTIADGNPAAVAIRSHWAQHCFIAHCDFHIGTARAAVEQVGNEIEDCRFFGGDYGIWTTKPSPSWPFPILDSSFTGQRIAGISTEEGGMCIIRNSFFKMPTAVLVHENRAEELVMKDCRLVDISGPAILASDVGNGRSQTNLTNLVCQSVPTLIKHRESGETPIATGNSYRVVSYTHGNQIADFGATPGVKTTMKLVPFVQIFADPIPSDLPPLPPTSTWVSVLKYGATGDGKTDDTAAIQKAINENKAVYLPTGRYKVTDTITLKPDTALIGLSPFSTQIFLADFAPTFTGDDPVKPMLQSSAGGKDILFGIGLDSGNNTRAVACKWTAGEHSYVNDIKFVGGHGTYRADGSGIPAYNGDREKNIPNTGDGDPKRVWNSIPYSLWITDNGGGTFKDIWSANPIAKAGVAVTNTTTSGRMYAISVEHHVEHEVFFLGVSNFQIFALQTEEERHEGPICLPLEITNCENLQFNNFYFYRVNLPQPYIAGIKVKNSKNLTFRGLHTYSPGKTTYDNAVLNLDTNETINSREIALLTIADSTVDTTALLSGAVILKAPTPGPVILPASSPSPEKLATGYENIDSLATDPAGNPYFLDAHAQKIFRYDLTTKETAALKDIAPNPVGIIFDTAGNLLVISARGTLHAYKLNGATATVIMPPPAPPEPVATAPASAPATTTASTEPVPARDLTAFRPTTMPTTPPANAKAYVHPQTRWKDDHDFLIVSQQLGNLMRPPRRGPGGPQTPVPPGIFTAPDGVTLIPQTEDLTRAYALTLAVPGKPCYIADEFGQKTYRFATLANGTLAKPELIAEEGECGVVADSKGNIYTAAGDIFVYDPAGKPLGTLKLPERPTSLALGGKSGKTLFIAARTSLYAIELKD